MVLKRDFLYYVYGANTEWTAICVDLDLAVEATSQREAIEKMEELGYSYIEDAFKEEPHVRDQLLNRSSPWQLRFSLWLAYQRFLFMRSRPHEKSVSAVALPCPA
jgi:hypothetical protein